MSYDRQVLSSFRADRRWWISRLFLPQFCCFGVIFLLNGVFISAMVEGILVVLCGWSEWGLLFYPLVMYAVPAALLAPWLFSRKQEAVRRMADQSGSMQGVPIHAARAPYRTMLFYCLISELPTLIAAGCIRMGAACIEQGVTLLMSKEEVFSMPLWDLLVIVPLAVAALFSWYKMQYVSASWFLAPEHTFRAAWKRDSGSPQRLRPEKRQRFGRAVWVMLLALVCYAALYTVLRLLFCQNFVPWGLGDYIFTFTPLGMIALWILGAVLIAGAGPFSWGSLKMRAIRMAAESRTLPPQ